MTEKINIAELLKDCPKGMELDCSMWDNVVFDHIDTTSNYPIYIKKMGGELEYLTEDGHFNFDCGAKCVIFPKGKTTWEGFQRPFMDGDVVATTEGRWIGITTGGEKGQFIPTYCVIQCDDEFKAYLDRKGEWAFNRLATEEEKQKLFQAIKDNGYKWNAETKTLDKLPKFKVGDKIVKKGDISVTILISEVDDECYYSTTEGSIGLLPIAEQDDWELVSNIEPKFKVGDKIKHKDSGIYCTLGEYSEGISAYRTNIGLSLTYKDMEQWELVPNKFDIDTLVPFESRVLVRDNIDEVWLPCFFGGICNNNNYPYRIVGGERWKCCIPYEGNEHLLGKTDDCEEYYKIWE